MSEYIVDMFGIVQDYGALFGITEDDYCSWGERKEGSE